MMVAVLRARQLLAGINGPGDAEIADRGSDIGEERDPHNEDGCTPDTEDLLWNLSMMIWTLVPPSQAMGSKVG